jgi:S-adenosylmethionine hydrolase
MSKIPIFAIITDFGFDFAVASMKGLILRNHPDAKIIDIEHSIEHFSILSAAFVIQKVYKYFPNDTIFICVVDPGVGTDRGLICIETDCYKFVGPNNGIFHYILDNLKAEDKVYKINNHFINSHSNTFHGRDILTPSAIELAKGNRTFLSLGNKADMVKLALLVSGAFVVLYIDGFGNIKTNIPIDSIKSDLFNICINGKNNPIKFVKTFGEVSEGELLC